MSTFFYICDYLGISPKEFFDIESVDPLKSERLIAAAKKLDKEKLEHLIAIAEGLSK